MKDLYLLLHLSVDEARCTCRQDERTGCSGREVMAPTCVPRSETSPKAGYLEISSHGLHSSGQKEGKGNVITPEHLPASSRSSKNAWSAVSFEKHLPVTLSLSGKTNFPTRTPEVSLGCQSRHQLGAPILPCHPQNWAKLGPGCCLGGCVATHLFFSPLGSAITKPLVKYYCRGEPASCLLSSCACAFIVCCFEGK